MSPRFFAWFPFLLVFALSSRPVEAADADPVIDGKAVSEWVKLLKSAKEAEQQRAAEVLGSRASESRLVVPALLGAVSDGEKTNQWAVDALIRIGPDAIPTLTAALWDDAAEKRGLALFVLSRMGHKARTAAGAVVAALGDSDPQNRRTAAQTLGAIGAVSTIPDLLQVLDQNDGPVDGDPLLFAAFDLRAGALFALMDLRADAKLLLPILVKWLRSKEPGPRLLAASTLVRLGAEATPAVPALMEALKDKDSRVQRRATESLREIGPAAKEAVPALVAALKSDTLPEDKLPYAEALWRIARHPDVAPIVKRWLEVELEAEPGDQEQMWRVKAAQLLWRIDKSPEAITALVEVLKRKTGHDVGYALGAVIRIGPEAKAALPALVPLLKAKDKNVRAGAAYALGRLGEHAKPTVRDLTALLDDPEPTVQGAAALSLWQINGDREAFKRIREGLRSENADARATTVSQLAVLGMSAKETAPAIRAALKDKSPAVRRTAAYGLGMMNDDSPEALTALTETLADPDAGVRAYAAGGLAYFGPRAKSAVPQLMKALWDENPQVRADAAETLGRIGPDAKAATRALIAILRSDDFEPEPSAAAEALGLIGPAAKEALPVLRAKLKHHDSYVRVCAALALWHIDKDTAGAATVAAALDDRRPRVRIVAAEAMWRMKESPRAIAVLLEMLRTASPSDDPSSDDIFGDNQRYMSARALGRIGSPAKDAVPDLQDLLNATDPYLRKTAAEALKQIDPEAARKSKVP